MEEKETENKMLPGYIYGGLAENESPTDVLAVNRLSGNDIIDRFAQLVYENGHLRMKFYTNKMQVPAGRFSNLFVFYSGMPPSHWIDSYIYLAAVDLLKKTEMPFEAIADRLGFTSVNVFSRFCKRMGKISPYKLRTGRNYHIN